ncbi:MAG: DUF1893 domain-containing protein [Oscillospiraceae bacterium]
MDAKQVLEQGAYSCVIERDGVIVSARRGIGVKPLLSAHDRYPGEFLGASVADRVIGKAAAMLLALGGVREVYGQVMSESAAQFLTARGIVCRCGESVPFISNRTHDGLCPIEQSVLALDDPEQGLRAIRATVARLMAAAHR